MVISTSFEPALKGLLRASEVLAPILSVTDVFRDIKTRKLLPVDIGMLISR
jgi:hypothetical protein